jgi:iron complex outermembrane receptor protein
VSRSAERAARAATLAATLAAFPCVAGAADPPAIPLGTVEVIGTAPLPGIGTPLEQVPANVQSFGARDIDRQRTSGVAGFLDANANGVSLASPTGNAFQPDVAFRGFTASALLGTPQGLSVFQDGVRINEAFADVVNWDFLPKNAVASMQLLPGSNPVFGLNTLGGALTIAMKDGFAFGGAGASVAAGSFGRVEVAADAGGNRDGLAAFAALEAIDDDGWREHSATRIRRAYARVDRRGGPDEWGLAATLADNRLAGTQALPVSMLGSPRQAYTWPDTTESRLAFLNGNAQHTLEGGAVLAGSAYWRRVRTTGVNSNVNGEFAPPAEPYEGFNVATAATTLSWGVALQATARRNWGAARHQIVAGAAYDAGATDFDQGTQPAEFSAQREAINVGAFAPSSAVTSKTHYAGAYVADTMAFYDGIAVVVSGRYNRARISTADRSGAAPAIDGTSTYGRFNPAAGATWTAGATFNAFAGVSQGMRVPTPVELTCADPAAPCTLPNIFVADPPLAPVRATTYEAGVRGRVAGASYGAAAYRTDLADDILFVAAGDGAVNSGYFHNVGRTRREGIELSAATSAGPLRLSARWSLVRATFETAFVERSPNNVTADASGDILVQPGNRIPGVPSSALRVRGDWTQGPFALGVSLVAANSQYARGNENNADPGGRVPGYAVVALDASWKFAREWLLFARVDNLFNASTQNFGILGANYFRGPGGTFAPGIAGPEPFRSPVPSFGAWIGVEYRLDPART